MGRVANFNVPQIPNFALEPRYTSIALELWDDRTWIAGWGSGTFGDNDRTILPELNDGYDGYDGDSAGPLSI